MDYRPVLQTLYAIQAATRVTRLVVPGLHPRRTVHRLNGFLAERGRIFTLGESTSPSLPAEEKGFSPPLLGVGTMGVSKPAVEVPPVSAASEEKKTGNPKVSVEAETHVWK